MNTIKIKRKVKSTLLKIRELEKFKGKNVELEIKIKEKDKKTQNIINKSFAGKLANYANVNLIDKENIALQLAVSDRHKN